MHRQDQLSPGFHYPDDARAFLADFPHGGTLSPNESAARTSLSQSRTEQIASTLESQRLILADLVEGDDNSAWTRRYRINPDGAYSIGITIDPVLVKLAVLDLDRNVRHFSSCLVSDRRVGDVMAWIESELKVAAVDTDSKASWKIDGRMRKIWLERGEIGVAVATDKRPCLIRAGRENASLSVGNLNARLRNKALDLTMLKGDCTVSKSDQKPTRIAAGEAALVGVSDTHIRQLNDADIQFVTAWQEDELVFDGQSLAVR